MTLLFQWITLIKLNSNSNFNNNKKKLPEISLLSQSYDWWGFDYIVVDKKFSVKYFFHG